MSEYSSPVGKMLGKIAGTYNGDVPEPSNELEKGLKDIAENGKPSGCGNDVIFANITYDENNEAFACDKTFSELKAAYDAGQLIIGVGIGFCTMTYTKPFSGKSVFIGYVIGINAPAEDSMLASTLRYARVQVYDDDTVIVNVLHTYTLTEAPSS